MNLSLQIEWQTRNPTSSRPVQMLHFRATWMVAILDFWVNMKLEPGSSWSTYLRVYSYMFREWKRGWDMSVVGLGFQGWVGPSKKSLKLKPGNAISNASEEIVDESFGENAFTLLSEKWGAMARVALLVLTCRCSCSKVTFSLYLTFFCIFGRDMGLIFSFTKGPLKSNQSSEHLSQRIVTKLRSCAQLFKCPSFSGVPLTTVQDIPPPSSSGAPSYCEILVPP